MKINLFINGVQQSQKITDKYKKYYRKDSKIKVVRIWFRVIPSHSIPRRQNLLRNASTFFYWMPDQHDYVHWFTFVRAWQGLQSCEQPLPVHETSDRLFHVILRRNLRLRNANAATFLNMRCPISMITFIDSTSVRAWRRKWLQSLRTVCLQSY
jgi:hypothetical protein